LRRDLFELIGLDAHNCLLPVRLWNFLL